jgi:tetratricopeptide (TPR) repeat protein
VDALLAAHDDAGPFLETPSPAPATPFMPPGTVIDRYKLLESIGEGGYGTVFMAEQVTPVQRKVALKIIKPGMDTRQVIARFDAERQALALMDHPNIAKVLDAGTTHAGRPYFVMELVKGLPITRYCDEQRIEPRQRLELIKQVCQAVQHAHQKGIIHRDIKPNNVLVALYDGKPVPKVIDFGVAKATGQRLTDLTMFTGFGDVIGTLEYMSPEQAEVNQLDVDTRSDIYSLGVLLYELLTGTTPLEHKRVMNAGLLEMLRVVREEEPQKPSTRLSNGEGLATIAANRGLEPTKLSGLVHGELDWIVMRALEKDRSRRYETANGLANDVQRYLRDETVQACPPTTRYRFLKFARRYRGPLRVAVAFALLLIAAVVVSTWQAVRATRAERQVARERDLVTAQKSRADEQAAIAKAVNRFMADMLSAADPRRVLGDKVTVVEAIDEAIKKLDAGALKDDPVTESAVRQTIGNTLESLGRWPEAEANLRKALDLRRIALPPRHTDIAHSLHELGSLFTLQGRFVEAESLLREAIDLHRKTPLAPENRPAAEEVALSYDLTSLGLVMKLTRRPAEAERLDREAIEIRRRILRPGSPDGQYGIAQALTALSIDLRLQGRQNEIEPLVREALALTRKELPTGHPHLNGALLSLAELLKSQGKPDEAEPLLREAMEGSRGAMYPDRVVILKNLGNLLKTKGRYSEAEPLYREALEIRFKVMPSGHTDIAESLASEGAILKAMGKTREANEIWIRMGQPYSEALEKRRQVEGDNETFATCLTLVGSLLQSAGRLEESETRYREALAIRQKLFGAQSREACNSLARIADSLVAQGKNLDEAEANYRDVLTFRRKLLDEGGPEVAASLQRLSDFLVSQGRKADAQELWRATVELRRAATRPDSVSVKKALAAMAAVSTSRPSTQLQTTRP